MVAPNVKAETMRLMDRRSALEAEMDAIIAALSAPGGAGITGGLVDAEGFPRADIDIPAVLAQRRELGELRNDHKDVTNKIEKNLEVLHSTKLSRNEQSTPRSSGAISESYEVSRSIFNCRTGCFHVCTCADSSCRSTFQHRSELIT